MALKEYEIYNVIKDSTLSAEKNMQILDVEAKYKWEKQQKEIEILTRGVDLYESDLARSKLQSIFFACIAVFVIVIFLFIFRAYSIKTKSNKKLGKLNNFLVESETKLLELNSMKDNLIKIIGHDLKNPLSSVLGFSELLANGKFKDQPEKINKFTKLILKTSIGISELLDNILYWAKLQQVSYSLNKTDFNVKETVFNAIQPYEGIAENKKININVECAKNLIASGDSFTYEIIIGNLINNALKYSHSSTNIMIKVSERDDHVLFSIKDFGVGMNESIRSQLFDNQVYKSMLGTAMETGTGFGLKICKQFVELNNGKLWVESKLGKGSIFYFTFPKNNTNNSLN